MSTPLPAGLPQPELLGALVRAARACAALRGAREASAAPDAMLAALLVDRSVACRVSRGGCFPDCEERAFARASQARRPQRSKQRPSTPLSPSKPTLNPPSQPTPTTSARPTDQMDGSYFSLLSAPAGAQGLASYGRASIDEQLAEMARHAAPLLAQFGSGGGVGGRGAPGGFGSPAASDAAFFGGGGGGGEGFGDVAADGDAADGWGVALSGGESDG